MSAHGRLPKEILDSLKTQGLKLTPARLAIIEVLCTRKMPVAVSELIAELAGRGIKADRATVYREIGFMQKREIVEQIQFGDRVKRYELVDEGHHHHLVCIECGKVVDVPLADDLHAAERAIARKTGYRIERHSLEFFGACPECK
jgi:Fe2+ or Zn2+ uptake regulation protein